MKTNARSKKMTLAIIRLLAVGALLAALPAAAAEPPVGRTYFIVSLGIGGDPGGAYEVGAGCLRFTREELCDNQGDCGIWWAIEEEDPLPRQSAAAFEFNLTDDETGLPIKIEGRGRIDARGPRSALAAVAHATQPGSGVTINFAIAGRAIGARKCERLAAEFEADQALAREGEER